MRQDKDDWSSLIRIMIDGFHTDCLVFDVHLAELLVDIICESKG